MRYLDEGWQDGISDGGGHPVTVKNKYLKVSWDFPSNVTQCTGFEIAVFLGTDPTATANYMVPSQSALPEDREVVIVINPSINLTGVNAVARAIYG